MSGLLFVFAVFFATATHAAPPTMTYLFPAGGQAGSKVAVKVTGKFSKDPIRVWCSRPAIKGTFATKNKTLTLVIPAKQRPGVCWLRLFNNEGSSSLKAFVVGTLPEVLETEPNDRLTQSQLLSRSTVVNGVISKAGGVDSFALSLKKGQTLVASMRANRALGSPMDGILQVVSSRGFVLSQNDDEHGFDPQIVFTAPADGTYHVRAFAFPTKPNSSIRLAGSRSYVYRLTVTTGPFIDHLSPLAITRGTTSQLRLHGWNIPKTSSRVTLPASKSNEPLGIRHPTFSDAPPLRVDPHATGIEREPNDINRAQLVKLPTTITGHIDQPRDTDVFRFVAKKGTRLAFRVEARSLGSPLDPVLRLFDRSGKNISRAETRSSKVIDETLKYTIRADGEYRLEVADLHRRGGWRFVYRLTLTVAQPDFAISVAASHFALPSGKPLTIPVTITRRDGIKGDIELSVVGLPPGVSAAKVRSTPKGATSKTVKLILTGKSPKAWNGPIRVEGQGVGNRKMRRIAEARIAGLPQKTTHLWLTVQQAKAKSAPAKSAKKKK